MVPFMLEISLRTPIILGHRLMLDSLLLGVARERFGDTAEREPPLKRAPCGLMHASQALLGTPEVPMHRSTTYVQSFIRVLTNDVAVTSMLQRQPSPSSMSHGSGPNSNIESVYVTSNIPTIYFLGVGNVAQIRRLTLTMVHIGAQAHKGNGEVERAVVHEIDADPTWFGIVGEVDDRLLVLRPVPKRMVSLLPPGVGGFDNTETWHYPYFPGHPKAVVEPCLVPPFSNHDYFYGDRVRRLSGEREPEAISVDTSNSRQGYDDRG
jgi:hypothetical protein